MPSFNTHGIFQELSYISIGDPYKDKIECISRNEDKEKQMLIKQKRKKKLRQEDEKTDNYPRIFIGECVNTYKGLQRGIKSTKDVGNGWIPTGKMNKICGSAGMDRKSISFLSANGKVKNEFRTLEKPDEVPYHDFTGWFNGIGGSPYPEHIPEHDSKGRSKKRPFHSKYFVEHPKAFITVCKQTDTFTSNYDLYRIPDNIPFKRKKTKKLSHKITPTHKRNAKRKPKIKKREHSIKSDPYKDPVVLFRPQVKNNVTPFYPQNGPKSLRVQSVLQTLINKKVNVHNRKTVESIY